MKQKQQYLLFLSLIILPFTSFCQQSKKSSLPAPKPRPQVKEFYFAIGHFTGSRINVDSFKLQTTINMSEGFSFAGASVYFSGTNFPNVEMAHLNGPSLSGIKTYIDRCQAGSVVTFDNVKVSGPDGLRTIDGRSFTLYSGNYDSLIIPVSKVNKQVNELMKEDFVAGTIYFSGANFRDVVITKARESAAVNAAYMRCGPGSIVSFDNCIYKKADNTLSAPVNLSLKLE